MIRPVLRAVVLAAAVAGLVGGVAGQPLGSPDKIFVFNRKDGTIKSYDGTLKLGAAGLQIVGSDGKVVATAAPADIVKITPGDLPGLDRNLVLNLLATEEKKTRADYQKAREGYLDLKKKLAGAPERTKRFVEFKTALMTTRVADETDYDDNWKQLAEEAVKVWNEFLTDYKSGYEVWVAARTLTRLLAELNRYDEAARVWNRLTRKDVDLPADLRQEAALEEIDCQIRSKLYPSALDLARTRFASTPAGPTKDKLDIYQAAAKAGADATFLEGAKAVEAKIAVSKDPAVRGVGYGMMGELYLAGGKPRDAMWAFLWVETVYNADKDAAFKAMCRLVEVFRLQNDDERVRAYRDKIRRVRSNL